MDEMVPECKKKLARFRIQELKDVLGQLGLARTGRKQELLERILALLYREDGDIRGSIKRKFIAKKDVAKIIDETYRKMQQVGASDSGACGHSVSDSSSITPTEETVDQKVQCPCGSTVKTEFMIQCADPQCNVLQHIPCVIVPEESSEEIPPTLAQFYCVLCRLNRSDPFWMSLAHPSSPAKLVVTSVLDDNDNSQPLQNLEATFQITRADVHLLESTGCDVQAWCILLNDTVPFRMHWPQYPDLKVNCIPVKTINRPGSKMLGANGRDDGPSISVYLVEGLNQISFSCSDERTFCFGVRLVRRRTFEQVVSLIPSEQDGESFADAVARVCRCLGGGTASAGEDSDCDVQVVADHVTINLRCPMSGSRMKTAARFKGCAHRACFDLDAFIQINERTRKWQCPTCLKNYSLEDIVIDPFINRIVKMVQACGEDVTEIQMKLDGSWRAKISYPFMDLEQWHLPDGSLSTSAAAATAAAATTEVPAERNNTLTVRVNGFRIPNVGVDQNPPALEIIDSSVKAENVIKTFNCFGTGGLFRDGAMMDCTPYNYDPDSGDTNRTSSSSPGDQELIVISDSDDDMIVPSRASMTCPPNGGRNLLAARPETRLAHLEDTAFRAEPSHRNARSDSSQTSDGEMPSRPFTFPRQTRTGRRQYPTTGVEGD